LDEQARAVTQSGPAFGVLVVEDDPVQRRLVEVSLKRHLPDLDIRLATDGFEGLMRIGERTPDVLITDLMMPGLDGFRMLESLQRNNATRGMQIIVITSLEDQQIKERGGLPSSAALMKKPLDSAHLNSLVGAFKIVWESRRSAP
ncbi:MAG: response regulator, partial [Zoogloea sp.]|uniref:response regulator n=1 Tax=Zoogloea sp. TaxID=49181 RepID=UPI003F315374